VHEVYPVPPGGAFSFHGRGFGHGHGMSQWGAYGAAKVRHLSANQILHFYFPHTRLATRSGTRVIRVLLTTAQASSRGYLEVEPADGLTLTPNNGDPVKLATETKKGHPINGWRLRADGAAVDLQNHFSGHWHTTADVGGGGSFTAAGHQVQVDLPGRKVRFRGAMVGELKNGSMEAVNAVPLDLYLRGVVPSEMPASWPGAALQAQAVAARTYAARGLRSPKASWFDVFGDTRDQAYGGVGSEAAKATKAIQHTAGEVIVDHDGHAILSQYSSADGGWSTSGGVPYLPAQHDPYDGLVPNTAHAWTSSVSAGSLESAYPAVGNLTGIVITGRDGNGLWGGRVTALTLQGSGTPVKLSGSDLQFALGLRSPWFRPVPRPGPPTSLAAKATGSTVTVRWKPPAHVMGAAAVTGYRVHVSPRKRRQTLPADARTTSVSKLPVGRHTVSVVALSDSGAGPGASVVVKTAHK
jgi:SpoIID/LytB domain protein